jgi:integrase
MRLSRDPHLVYGTETMPAGTRGGPDQEDPDRTCCRFLPHRGRGDPAEMDGHGGQKRLVVKRRPRRQRNSHDRRPLNRQRPFCRTYWRTPDGKDAAGSPPHGREGQPGRYVFVSERLAPLSVAGYQRMVARAGEATGFPFLLSSHVLRHSCGYKLANDGGTPDRSSTIWATGRLSQR